MSSCLVVPSSAQSLFVFSHVRREIERLMSEEPKISGEAYKKKVRLAGGVVTTQKYGGGTPQQKAERNGAHPVRVGEGLAARQGVGRWWERELHMVEANASGPDGEWYHCH